MDDDSFKRFFRETFEQFKEDMKEGFPVVGVSPLDPLEIGDFKFEVDESLIKKKGNFTGVVVAGLSKIKVATIDFDRSNSMVTATVTAKCIKASGQYELAKPLGAWSVEVERGVATISMHLGSLDLTDLKAVTVSVKNLSFRSGKIDAHFDNLEGGDLGGAELENAITVFGKKSVELLEPKVSDIIGDALQKFVNSELENINPDDAEASLAALPQTNSIKRAFFRPVQVVEGLAEKATTKALNALFDVIIHNVNAMMAKKGFDPLKSADSPEISFEGPLGVTGGAKAEAPTLYGLSHLKRTGDIELHITKFTMVVNMGIDGSVSGSCGAQAWLGPVTVGPHVSFDVTNISVRVVMKLERIPGKHLLPHHKAVIETLDLATPDISVDIDGLGTLAWITGKFTGPIVTAVLHLFKDEWVSALQKFIQSELDIVTIPI